MNERKRACIKHLCRVTILFFFFFSPIFFFPQSFFFYNIPVTHPLFPNNPFRPVIVRIHSPTSSNHALTTYIGMLLEKRHPCRFLLYAKHELRFFSAIHIISSPICYNIRLTKTQYINNPIHLKKKKKARRGDKERRREKKKESFDFPLNRPDHTRPLHPPLLPPPPTDMCDPPSPEKRKSKERRSPTIGYACRLETEESGGCFVEVPHITKVKRWRRAEADGSTLDMFCHSNEYLPPPPNQ